MEKVRHSDNCKMVFGRKDPSCPRCVELINGAKPRGWALPDVSRLAEIRAHDCNVKNCGPVCTFGDY